MRDSGDVGPMTVSLDERPDSPSRVLLFSQRNIYEVEVWRSAIREFEEIVGEIDSVDVLAPHPLKWFTQRKRIALRVGRDSRIVLNPGVQTESVVATSIRGRLNCAIANAAGQTVVASTSSTIIATCTR